ncbi:MAG: EAL domain-containing protein [Yoonia sp.]|nr:EAL domain-containing protein [Yoonia sp.]MBE0413615.1 EAL domain-containing protein [Yoonia sp.]
MSSQNADAGILVQTMDGITLWANDAYYRIMKRTPQEVLGRNPLSFALPPDKTPEDAEIKAFRHDNDDPTSTKIILRENIRGDGKTIWLETTTSFQVEDGDEERAILVCRDVTNTINRERRIKAASDKLTHIAAHDTLTGLANRGEFLRFINQEMTKKQQQTTFGILHIDLDNFKQINDTHGHSAGDTILVTIAGRMRECMRETDLIARIGGDEFVAVCTGLHSLEELEEIGKCVIEAVEEPIIWDNRALRCGISIGAALSNENIMSADDLLVRSDFALYDVKKNGRGRIATYNKELYVRHTNERCIAHKLHKAVQNESLAFLYQPIVGIASGQIRGFETLVRLNRPTGDLLAPTAFFPVARSLGLMADIDFLAMRAATNLKAQLNAADFGQIYITFNVSPEAISHPDFASRLDRDILSHALRCRDIIIELPATITQQIHDNDSAIKKAIIALNKAGYITILDHFDCGNVGLGHLAKLAVSGIKLDCSMTGSIRDDHKAMTIFTTLIDLCRKLDLSVVIKSVEDPDQASLITDCGGDVMQGFWIAPPMPEEEVIPWLSANTDCPGGMASLSKEQLIP